jgi:hypothetical protein
MFDIYLLRCRLPIKVAELVEKEVPKGKRRVHSERGRCATSNEAILRKKDVTFVMWKCNKLRCAN